MGGGCEGFVGVGWFVEDDVVCCDWIDVGCDDYGVCVFVLDG